MRDRIGDDLLLKFDDDDVILAAGVIGVAEAINILTPDTLPAGYVVGVATGAASDYLLQIIAGEPVDWNRVNKAAGQGAIDGVTGYGAGQIGRFAARGAGHVASKAWGAATRAIRQLLGDANKPLSAITQRMAKADEVATAATNRTAFQRFMGAAPLERRARPDWLIRSSQSMNNKEAILGILDMGNSFSKKLAQDIRAGEVAFKYRRLSSGTDALYVPQQLFQRRPTIYINSDFAFQGSQGIYRAAVAVVHEGQHFADNMAGVINWNNGAVLEYRAFLREAKFAADIGRPSYSVFGRYRTSGNPKAIDYVHQLYPEFFP